MEQTFNLGQGAWYSLPTQKADSILMPHCVLTEHTQSTPPSTLTLLVSRESAHDGSPLCYLLPFSQSI